MSKRSLEPDDGTACQARKVEPAQDVSQRFAKHAAAGNIIPSIPPRAAKKDRPQMRIGLCEQAGLTMGIQPREPDYGPSDTALWPMVPAEVMITHSFTKY